MAGAIAPLNMMTPSENAIHVRRLLFTKNFFIRFPSTLSTRKLELWRLAHKATKRSQIQPRGQLQLIPKTIQSRSVSNRSIAYRLFLILRFFAGLTPTYLTILA